MDKSRLYTKPAPVDRNAPGYNVRNVLPPPLPAFAISSTPNKHRKRKGETQNTNGDKKQRLTKEQQQAERSLLQFPIPPEFQNPSMLIFLSHAVKATISRKGPAATLKKFFDWLLNAHCPETSPFHSILSSYIVSALSTKDGQEIKALSSDSIPDSIVQLCLQIINPPEVYPGEKARLAAEKKKDDDLTRAIEQMQKEREQREKETEQGDGKADKEEQGDAMAVDSDSDDDDHGLIHYDSNSERD